MKKPNSQIKRLLVILFFILAFFCVAVPTPYYVEGPGATIQLDKLISVDGKKDQHSGSFSLTSVGVRQATVWRAVKSKFADFQELVTKEELMGTATNEEYDRIQNYYMESSQNTAIEQALKLAKIDYQMEYMGVYVLAIDPSSSFYKKISVGDTITKVNGKSFENVEDLIAYVQGQKVDQEITITYLQDNKQKEATGKLMALPKPNKGKAGIGITLTSHTKIDSKRKVTFDVNNIGGPSAGLMFTLEIYQQLIDHDLRHGLEIAGTGTMNSDGSVGQIGGIDKKVASASQSGAEIFFAPKGRTKEDTNYQEAKAAAKKLGTKMKIVPIGTLQEAVDYLAKLN